jgi:molecular chaperone GrpE
MDKAHHHKNGPEQKEKPAQAPEPEKEPATGESLEESVSEIVEECVDQHTRESHKGRPDHHKHGEGQKEDHGAKEKKPEFDPRGEEIRKLNEEIECLKDSRLRLLAEFDNYKRRTARENLKFIETANESLIKSILPVLENFERALHPDHKNSDTESLLKGIELIYNQFFEALKKAGLSDSNPVGEEFDSEKHEALMHVESADVPENRIVQVLQKGYSINNKMIQYAKVSVSKGDTKT